MGHVITYDAWPRRHGAAFRVARVPDGASHGEPMQGSVSGRARRVPALEAMMVRSIRMQVLGGNLECEGVEITRASVGTYEDMLEAAVRARFPEARVTIDVQWNASGALREDEVVCDDWREEHAALDALTDIANRVWMAWVMEGGAA